MRPPEVQPDLLSQEHAWKSVLPPAPIFGSTRFLETRNKDSKGSFKLGDTAAQGRDDELTHDKRAETLHHQGVCLSQKLQSRPRGHSLCNTPPPRPTACHLGGKPQAAQGKLLGSRAPSPGASRGQRQGLSEPKCKHTWAKTKYQVRRDLQVLAQNLGVGRP